MMLMLRTLVGESGCCIRESRRDAKIRHVNLRLLGILHSQIYSHISSVEQYKLTHCFNARCEAWYPL